MGESNTRLNERMRKAQHFPQKMITLYLILRYTFIFQRVANELRENNLFLDGQRLLVADQVDQLLGIMKQVVLPRVLADLELFTRIVLRLRNVDLFDYFLEWLRYILLKIRRLPVVNGSLNELEAH